jgi:hypothetical protein
MGGLAGFKVPASCPVSRRINSAMLDDGKALFWFILGYVLGVVITSFAEAWRRVSDEQGRRR